MNLRSINYPVSILGAFLAVSGSQIHAGTMEPVPVGEKVYLSVFGGGGASNKVGISQYATAFYPETSGGPLAINAFGKTNSRNVGIIGGQIGYQWEEILLNSLSIQRGLSPAVELEGYYLRKSSFTGHDISNDTTRLPEHDFLVTYPLSSGVFLANAVLNYNSETYTKLYPYVGAGIGAAVLSISGADALQVAPAEANVNHYNGNPNDTLAVFAAQTKVGLNYAFSEYLSVFAEYRWLYLAGTNFTFGSTVYPTHAPTRRHFTVRATSPHFYNI